MLYSRQGRGLSMTEHKTDTPETRKSGTVNLSLSIIIAILIQTSGIVWWASQVSAQVATNTDNITTIQDSLTANAAIVLTRQQLDDILGARDARLDNIEQQLDRIENKLQ